MTYLIKLLIAFPITTFLIIFGNYEIFGYSLWTFYASWLAFGMAEWLIKTIKNN